MPSVKCIPPCLIVCADPTPVGEWVGLLPLAAKFA
jgi:hypothetical protein